MQISKQARHDVMDVQCVLTLLLCIIGLTASLSCWSAGKTLKICSRGIL